jgi:hypothetical protein
MKTLIRLLICVLFGSSVACTIAATQLTIDRQPATLTLSFPGEVAKQYQLQVSTNLVEWINSGEPLDGTGQVISHQLSMTASAQDFFRVVIVDTAVDLAPTPEEFSERVAGRILFGYSFTSDTRFSWFGETGNWTYEKTGADAGTVVLTYDEDGNDPGRYREEILLTFIEPGSGTFRYSEYNFGVEDPGSIGEGNFQLQ